MTHTRTNRGTCSSQTTVSLDADGVIEKVEVAGGCSGNLQGISRLLAGRNARDVIELMQGTNCKDRGTSCPDQIARCLAEALEKLPG